MTVCKTPVNCIDRRDCVERDCDNFSELLRQRLVSGTFSGCAFVFAGDRKEKTDPCGAGGKLSGDHGFILSAVFHKIDQLRYRIAATSAVMPNSIAVRNAPILVIIAAAI